MEVEDEGLASMIEEAHDTVSLREFWASTLRALPLDSVPYFGCFYDPSSEQFIAHSHVLDVLPFVCPLLEFAIHGVLMSTRDGTGVIDVEWAAMFRDHYLSNGLSKCAWKKSHPPTPAFLAAMDVLKKHTQETDNVYWIIVYQDGDNLKVLGTGRVASDYPIIAFLFYTLSGMTSNLTRLSQLLQMAAIECHEINAPGDPYGKMIAFFANWINK